MTFEVYSGTGEDKQPAGKRETLNDAITYAWERHGKTYDHYGVLYQGKVVFNTNFNDPEFDSVKG